MNCQTLKPATSRCPQLGAYSLRSSSGAVVAFASVPVPAAAPTAVPGAAPVVGDSPATAADRQPASASTADRTMRRRVCDITASSSQEQPQRVCCDLRILYTPELDGQAPSMHSIRVWEVDRAAAGGYAIP